MLVSLYRTVWRSSLGSKPPLNRQSSLLYLEAFSSLQTPSLCLHDKNNFGRNLCQTNSRWCRTQLQLSCQYLKDDVLYKSPYECEEAQKTRQVTEMAHWLHTLIAHSDLPWVGLPTWNVLLGIEQVVIKSGLFPVNSLFLIGLGVWEALCCSTLPSKKTTQIRSLHDTVLSDLNLLMSSPFSCVSGRARTCLWPPPGSGTWHCAHLVLKNLPTLARVTVRSICKRRHDPKLISSQITNGRLR